MFSKMFSTLVSKNVEHQIEGSVIKDRQWRVEKGQKMHERYKRETKNTQTTHQQAYKNRETIQQGSEKSSP